MQFSVKQGRKGGVREPVLHMENIAEEPMTQKVMTGSCKI